MTAITEVPIERHVREGVAELTLNRPHRKNAITNDLVAALHTALQQSEDDGEVGAVLISGADGHLCSGIDLKEAELRTIGPAWQAMHRFVARMHTPVVIAHEGAAINAGAALALSADMLVCADSAFLQIMEAKIGMTPPVNIAWLVHKHSASIAQRLALSGERVDGPSLGVLGIAHRVVGDGEAVNAARELATEIASFPKATPQAIKAQIAAATSASGVAFDVILDAVNATNEGR